LSSFQDVRDLLKALEEQGVEIVQNGIQSESGPVSFAVLDPDGNPVLFDQHV